MCALLNNLSILCSSHSMSEEGSSSNTLEARSSASEASASSPATVPNVVRTLQDVERDIQEEKAKLNRYRKQCDDAFSARVTARTAEERANAEKSMDTCRYMYDITEKHLESLVAERAQFQAAATASSSEQKSKFLFCVYFVPLTVRYRLCQRFTWRVALLHRPLCCIFDSLSYC